MVKKILCSIIILIFTSVYSQNKSFIYELKFKPNPTKDSIVKESFVLDVEDGKSMFRTIKDKQADSTFLVAKRISFMTTSFKDFKTVSKNLKTNEIKKYINNFQKLFSIKIDDQLIWKIETESKEISSMKTQKAVTEYGGRKWTAWFTNDIPIQDGPYIFHGLPGLILEIADDKNDYVFSLIQIRNSDGKLYEKEGALPITWKQYDKLRLDYFADPTREINGKNSGGSMHIIKWQDEHGNEFTPNFKEMNEKEQKIIRENNNPIEWNRKINYPK